MVNFFSVTLIASRSAIIGNKGGRMSPAPNLTSCSTSVDRRHHPRFPTTASAEYFLHGRRGELVARDMSSGGILVESAEILPPGERIELRMNWPRRLDGQCPLRLIIMGKVLKITSRGTVISIVRYEYRLAPKAPSDLPELDEEAGKTGIYSQA
jgi:hypothetical protein